MSLTPAFLDELRARTTLSALVGRTVKLQRAGREYRACCPFHNEKSPSFYVNDDKGFYHCFGCGAHGDAIRWMTEQQGLPFIDAVKELAQAAGLDMPEQDRRAAQKAERARSLHDAMAAAAKWYEDQLWGLGGEEARALLDRRGVRPDTARAFGLGFAPDSRGQLRKALAEFGDAMLVECGLLIQVDGKEPYDRFRGRLMIPIRNARGRVIAFGGRIIGAGEPKYLNSPETPLFDKGRTLYNLDRAGAASRKAGRVIAVEGYMDVIALAQSGFGEAVAPLGTALTEAQLERLWRMADVPILCFDGDAAGQKAAIRAAERALPMLAPGKSLEIATLPDGLDPDDIVGAGGAKAFESIIKRARSLDDHIWTSEFGTLPPQAGPDERAALLHRLQQAADTIREPIIRDQYRSALRERFYGVFGSRAQRMSVVQAAADGPVHEERRGLQFTLHRAVLLGLMRYPEVLVERSDEVSSLPIVHRKLREWRDILVEWALQWPAPELAELTHEMLGSDFGLEIERRCYRKDLAFSFYFERSESTEPADDLRRLLELLIEEHVARRAAALRNAEAVREMTEASFAAQRAAVLETNSVHQRLSTWLEQFREAA
ncbi:DNA primase [Sphingomonas spermidinifaciens]|uniref:DNA primase n=1 Tax=Sphingomonas spermidinifaciens TaxID=1141889 RepID=A0A2A4B5X1_9SPHN|nr:DNA primase [Sphingomonas spermidinifaciens]PCD03189.1 DNA primase [Sphingomonas spermidinifaciens]